MNKFKRLFNENVHTVLSRKQIENIFIGSYKSGEHFEYNDFEKGYVFNTKVMNLSKKQIEWLYFNMEKIKKIQGKLMIVLKDEPER